MVRELAQVILEDQGFQVVLAANGREAVDVLTKDSDAISAVLLDMSMPELSGEDVLRELHGVLPSMPVVLSSGYERDEFSVASNDHTAFLRKPYSPQDLIDHIRRVI